MTSRVRAVRRPSSTAPAPAWPASSAERVRCSPARRSSPGQSPLRAAGAAFAAVASPPRSPELAEPDVSEPPTPEVMSSLAPQTAEEKGAADVRRLELTSALSAVPFFDPAKDARSFHGRGFRRGKGALEPQMLWKSDKKPRDGSEAWLTASEYGDEPEVLGEKVAFLAELLRVSRRTVAYTGAGLSVAAGIKMAATGSTSGRKTTDATPTLSHYVMAALNRSGLLHGWVQQNHDGLPQKAGYKQEDINEVHGSWYDPSNPVVKYSGSLRDDLYEDMLHQAVTADLCLVFGTSLTGLNADQVATKPADRSQRGLALGTVIISPQRTSQDGKATLRFFAKADEVMQALAHRLGFGAPGLERGPRCVADPIPRVLKVVVPYDENGVRSETVRTFWDLTEGARVRLGDHHNCAGAKQPNTMKLTSKVVGQVSGRDDARCAIRITIGGTGVTLGLWWLTCAQRGGVEHLPVVNAPPQVVRP